MRVERTSSLVSRVTDGAIIVILAAFTLAVRYLTLEEVEGGGDALASWYFVRQWIHGVDFATLTWDHHTARFGINIPVYVVQRLLGSHATTYYVAPVTACVVAVVFTYKIARDLSGPYAGVLAGLSLAVFPPMERAGSQLLPGVFAAAYVSFASYAVLRYWRSNHHGMRWILAGAVAMFLAYLSHEPTVFFLPGLAYGIWLYRRSWRAGLAFGGALAALLLLEKLWYIAFTQYASRIAVTLSQHGPGLVSGLSSSGQSDVWTLFDRFDRSLETSWKLALFGFMTAGPALLALGPRRARGPTLGAMGFLVGVTFAVNSLDPLTAWLSFQSRYWVPVAPLAMAANSVVIVAGAREFLRGFERYRVGGNGLPLLFTLLCTLSLGWVYAYGLKGRLPSESGWVGTRRKAESFAETFQRGLPFTGANEAGLKAVRLAVGVYLPDQLLAHEGKLPRLEDVIHVVDGHLHWFAKDTPEGAFQTRAILDQNQQCQYRMAIKGRFLAISPGLSLPSDCTKASFEVR
ncbi:MAG: glycosyltransferase family 39 protein [Polyangiaceae bacterium]|nr:glycosyltransferase family 39 protein [Polyangiaceae bacterium]